jgi:hypothetical protein
LALRRDCMPAQDPSLLEEDSVAGGGWVSRFDLRVQSHCGFATVFGSLLVSGAVRHIKESSALPRKSCCPSGPLR